MVRVILIEYTDEDGNRVFWPDSFDEDSCAAMVEIMREDNARPVVRTFWVPLPVSCSQHTSQQHAL